MREAAQEALFTLGHLDFYLPGVVKELHNEDSAIRCASIKTIGNLGKGASHLVRRGITPPSRTKITHNPFYQYQLDQLSITTISISFLSRPPSHSDPSEHVLKLEPELTPSL